MACSTVVGSMACSTVVGTGTVAARREVGAACCNVRSHQTTLHRIPVAFQEPIALVDQKWAALSVGGASEAEGSPRAAEAEAYVRAAEAEASVRRLRRGHLWRLDHCL